MARAFKSLKVLKVASVGYANIDTVRWGSLSRIRIVAEVFNADRFEPSHIPLLFSTGAEAIVSRVQHSAEWLPAGDVYVLLQRQNDYHTSPVQGNVP